MNHILNNIDGVYRVKAYIEYEIEAYTEEHAIQRMTGFIMQELGMLDGELEDIAEVTAERISDGLVGLS